MPIPPIEYHWWQGYKTVTVTGGERHKVLYGWKLWRRNVWMFCVHKPLWKLIYRFGLKSWFNELLGLPSELDGSKSLYCVQCKWPMEHLQRSKGNSWHMYCCGCDLPYFALDHPERKPNKSLQRQIDSWIISNAKT